MSLIQQIEEVIEDHIRDSEYFLVDIAGKENKGKMQFLIDGDHGITIDKCSEISRAVSRYIDEHDLGNEKFIYEISSPGVDRPLKLLRQYPQHIGRELEVKLNNGEILDGVLQAVEEHHIELEISGNKKEVVLKEISIGDIEQSKVLISFKN